MQKLETASQLQERLKSSSTISTRYASSPQQLGEDLSAAISFLETHIHSSDKPSFELLKSLARLLVDAFSLLAKPEMSRGRSSTLLKLLEVSTMPIKAVQKGGSSYLLMFCGKKRLSRLLVCLVNELDFLPPSKWTSDFLYASSKAFFTRDDYADRNNSILLSEILLTLVKIGMRINDAWLDEALEAISVHAKGGVMRPGEIAMALWALSKLGHRPQASRLYPLTTLIFPPPSERPSEKDPIPLASKELSALLYALVRMRYDPRRSWLESVAERIEQIATEPSLSSSLSVPPQDVAGLLGSLVKMDFKLQARLQFRMIRGQGATHGATPSAETSLSHQRSREYLEWVRSGFIPRMVEALLGQGGWRVSAISSYATRDLAATLWACGKLRWRPKEEWLMAAINNFSSDSHPRGPRLGYANSQDVMMMLTGLANLHRHTGHVRLSVAWVDHLLASTRSKLIDYPPMHLALVFYALSGLQVTPGLEWMVSFASAVGAGGQGGRASRPQGTSGLVAFNFQQLQLIGKGLKYQLDHDPNCRTAEILELSSDIEGACRAANIGYMEGKRQEDVHL